MTSFEERCEREDEEDRLARVADRDDPARWDAYCRAYFNGTLAQFIRQDAQLRVGR